MFGKSSVSFIILHIYIITYLIATVIGASENVMLIMHVISPFVVISTLYFVLKTFREYPSAKEEKNEEYKVY